MLMFSSGSLCPTTVRRSVDSVGTMLDSTDDLRSTLFPGSSY
eukprot:gene10388-10455_t